MKRIERATLTWYELLHINERIEVAVARLLTEQGLDPDEQMPAPKSPEQTNHEVKPPVSSWSGFVAQPDPALKAEALRLCAKFVDVGWSQELTVEHLLLTARLCGVTKEQVKEVSK